MLERKIVAVEKFDYAVRYSWIAARPNTLRYEVHTAEVLERERERERTVSRSLAEPGRSRINALKVSAKMSGTLLDKRYSHSLV